MNPKFDDVQCTGRGTAGRVAAREEYIRSAYADADEKLGIARALLGGDLRRVRPRLRARLLRGQRQRRAEPGVGDVRSACARRARDLLSSVQAAVSPRTATTASVRRPSRTTSPRPAGPVARSRSTSILLASAAHRRRPTRRGRATPRSGRRSRPPSRPSPTRRIRGSGDPEDHGQGGAAQRRRPATHSIRTAAASSSLGRRISRMPAPTM